MLRVVWKGAIAFGLVHIPVSLYPASGAKDIDLDLLDRRDFARVGYQRVNKRTGETVASEDIVKGYDYGDGQYVVVSDEDFRQASVEATRTVDIFAFVDEAEIPPYHFETPYYLEPGKRADKGYALLRETLRHRGRVGLATVVIRTRQRLAAVVPHGDGLLLNTLRFADEIRPMEQLALPGDDLKKLGISPRELQMAEQLVDGMTEPWSPEDYHDTYREALLERIDEKVRAGKTHVVTPPAAEAEEAGAEVVDLMALLKRSLEAKPTPKRAAHGRGTGSGTTKARAGKSAPDTHRRHA